MSFTTPAQIKSHLLNSTRPVLHVENERVQLSGTADVELAYGALVSSSESVKRDCLASVITSGPHVLTETNWSDLSASQVVAGTVVVTVDDTCQLVYREELDYQIDYETGRIRRTPGSDIPNQTGVYVYFASYELLRTTTDYVIDYEHGLLRRTSTGAIPDGGAVLIDYDVGAGSVEDTLIEQAIVEAEDVIVRNLAPGYSSSSADQGLKTGACYLVLSIIARALCTEFLGRRTSADGATRAKEWITLSERYEAKAYEVLRPFLNPIALRAGLRMMNE
jgi:hypothetical protein